MQDNKVKYLLNPDYFFLDDLDRVALRSKAKVNFDSNSGWLSFIHPFQANVLSAFLTPISIEGALEKLRPLYKFSRDVFEKNISFFIDNKVPIYSTVGEHSTYFPKNLLIKYNGEIIHKENCSPERIGCDFYEYNNVNLINDRLHKAPRTLLIVLTNRCKSRCVYCYADTFTKCNLLTYKELLPMILEAKSLNIDNIDLVGGEVFCHPEWSEFVEKLVSLDMSPTYLSTKIALSDNEIKLLKSTGYDNVVQISLDSVNSVTLNKMIGVKGEYLTELKNSIIKLIENGFKLQVNTVLTNHNSTIQEISALYDYIKSIKGLEYWELRIPEMSLYSTEDFIKSRATKTQLENIIRYAREHIIPDYQGTMIINQNALLHCYQSKTPNDNTFFGGSCGILREGLVLLPDGKASVCEQLYWHPDFIVGDIRTQTLEEIWQSEKAWNIYGRKGKYAGKYFECEGCSMSDNCDSQRRKCWVHIMRAYGRNEWQRADPLCTRSSIHIHQGLKY